MLLILCWHHFTFCHLDFPFLIIWRKCHGSRTSSYNIYPFLPRIPLVCVCTFYIKHPVRLRARVFLIAAQQATTAAGERQQTVKQMQTRRSEVLRLLCRFRCKFVQLIKIKRSAQPLGHAHRSYRQPFYEIVLCMVNVTQQVLASSFQLLKLCFVYSSRRVFNFPLITFLHPNFKALTLFSRGSISESDSLFLYDANSYNGYRVYTSKRLPVGKVNSANHLRRKG